MHYETVSTNASSKAQSVAVAQPYRSAQSRTCLWQWSVIITLNPQPSTLYPLPGTGTIYCSGTIYCTGSVRVHTGTGSAVDLATVGIPSTDSTLLLVHLVPVPVM